jgi:hypothetical protein
MLALQHLSGAKAGDYYEADQNGVQRLMTSGVRLSVAGNQVRGRVYLSDGSYDDEVYEKPGSGEWRIKSGTHVQR